MFILDYIKAHYVMLMELVGMWILFGISVHVSKRMLRFTRAAVILLFLNSILTDLERWTGNFETLSVWRPILSYTVYALQPVILILIMQITAPIKRAKIWIVMPAILSAVLYFTSPLTHYVCWFTEDNHFQRGPLSYLPYIVFGFYVVVFLIQFSLYTRKNLSRDRPVVFYVVLSAVAGVIIYFVFDVSDDYSAIYTSSILLYYLFLYIHMARLDPLTELLNRQCYYRDIASNASRITSVASVDMNDLKRINDTQGHAAGDSAIKTIAVCLTVNSGKNKTVYRVGGDEFMVFYYGKSEDEVAADVQAMRDALAETPYVCAFGYAMTNDSDDIESVIRESDGRMYEDKARLKREALEQGGELHERED